MALTSQQSKAVLISDGDRFLTRREAAALLGLANSTLAAWRSKGWTDAPPLYKFGRTVRYSERELLAWSEQRRA